MIRRPIRRGKPLKPETERWILENDVKAWCFEVDMMAAAKDDHEWVFSLP